MGVESFNNNPVPPQEDKPTVETIEKKEELSKLMREATYSIENEYKTILGHDLNGYEFNRATWMAEFPESVEEFTKRLIDGGIDVETADRMTNLETVQDYYKKLEEGSVEQ